MQDLIKTLTGEDLSQGFSENDMIVVAYFTDHADFYKLPLTDEEKTEMLSGTLLECRFFNSNGEIKLTRGSIFEKWKVRVVTSDQTKNMKSWQEWQYLDIDATSVDNADPNYIKVKTMGGGHYRIPKTDVVNQLYCDYQSGSAKDLDIKICVEYYADYYDATGQAYIKDWRLVRIGKGA